MLDYQVSQYGRIEHRPTDPIEPRTQISYTTVTS